MIRFYSYTVLAVQYQEATAPTTGPILVDVTVGNPLRGQLNSDEIALLKAASTIRRSGYDIDIVSFGSAGTFTVDLATLEDRGVFWYDGVATDETVGLGYEYLIDDALIANKKEKQVLTDKFKKSLDYIVPVFVNFLRHQAAILYTGSFRSGDTYEVISLYGIEYHYNGDTSNPKRQAWVFTVKAGDIEFSIDFRQPTYNSISINRGVERFDNVKDESALSFNVVNESDAPITKNVTETVTIQSGHVRTSGTETSFNATSSTSINASTTIGGMAGFKIDGIEASAYASATFGSAWSNDNTTSYTSTNSSSNENSTTKTRTLSDTIILQPLGLYQIDARYRTADVHRTDEFVGYVIPHISLVSLSIGGNPVSNGALAAIQLEVGSQLGYFDFLSALVGSDPQLIEFESTRYIQIATVTQEDLIAIDGMLAEDNVPIRLNREMTYRNSSDMNLRVTKLASLFYDSGDTDGTAGYAAFQPTFSSSIIPTFIPGDPNNGGG